jgi:hypothetical protein
VLTEIVVLLPWITLGTEGFGASGACFLTDFIALDLPVFLGCLPVLLLGGFGASSAGGRG